MANQFTHKFEEMDAPITYWERIKELEEEMDDNIHDLVWQYGTPTNDGDYEFDMYDKGFKHYCYVRDEEHTLVKIKKCIILCPEKCQVRGHLMFITTEGEQATFFDLPHQQYNVYSHIHKMIDAMLIAEP